MNEQTTIEYGVFQQNREGIHRGPYATREQAEQWVREAEEDGFPAGVFYVRQRTVSPWQD